MIGLANKPVSHHLHLDQSRHEVKQCLMADTIPRIIQAPVQDDMNPPERTGGLLDPKKAGIELGRSISSPS